MKATLVYNEPCTRLLNADHRLESLLGDLTKFLEGIHADFRKGSNSSEKLRSKIVEFFDGWTENLLVQPDFPTRKFPSSHVRVDFQKELEPTLEFRKTQVTAELFADNRQAVASNLFKLELAGRNFAHFGEALGIGITIGQELKEDGWDSATAAGEEYEYALLHTYQELITRPIALIRLSR